MDKNNLGSFNSLQELWEAHPEGGHEGDYATVNGVVFRWNKYNRIWSGTGTPMETYGRKTDLHEGDVVINNDLTVAGMIRARGVKQPNKGLFHDLASLQKRYPFPEVGWWATVGDSVPGQIYRCDQPGVWSATGETGGLDSVDYEKITKIEQLLQEGYTFIGVATSETNPGTPNQKVFYIANGKGKYEKFGGLEVTEDEVVILCYDTTWHKVLTGIASQAKLDKALAIAYSNGYLNANNVAKKFETTKVIKVYYKGQYLTVAEGTEVAYRLDSNQSSMYAVCVNPSDSTLEILGYADEARKTTHPIIATYRYDSIKVLGFIGFSINVSIDDVPFDGVSFNNRFLNVDKSIENVKKSISENTSYIEEITKEGGFSLQKSEPYYYIRTGISLGSVVDMTPSHAEGAYRYSIFPATYGDTFKIYGTGGGDARLWAFVDSTYHLLSVSKVSAVADGDIISAPENTAYLIINDSSGKKSYYNEGVKQISEYCKNTLDKIYNEIQFIDGVFYNVNGNVGDTATLAETSFQNYKSVKLACNADDTFIVNATAGGASAKPYTFIDSNNVILANSGYSTSYYGVITAPKNAAYVIIETNTKTLISYASKGHMLIDTRVRVLKIESKNIDFSSIQSLGNNGVFNSFELSVPNDASCSPMIVSAYAKYITSGSVPTIQFSMGTLFTSISYTIGGNDNFSLKEWRIPPMLFNKDLKIKVTVPEGCTLTITDFSCFKDREYGARQSGVMLDAHLGFQGIAPENSMIAFELAAQCGYQSCIVTPITSADGTIYCYHEDDATLSLDGITSVALSAVEFAALTDAEIAKYKVLGFGAQKTFYNEKIPTLDEFFYLCSKTGMRPVFSTHPSPTDAQWQTIKSLLVKYRLLDKIIIKAADISVLEKAYSVLGNIRGFIYDVSGVDASAYCQSLKNSTLSNYNGEIGIEYMKSNITQTAVETTLAAGYFASVWDVGRISGERYKELIGWGVSEFTDDYNCSNGLNW